MLRLGNPYRPSKQGLSFFTTASELSLMLGGSGVANYAGWCAGKCPAHGDEHASLSIKDVPGGKLFKCFARCTAEEVVAAINDLYKDGRISRVPTINVRAAQEPRFDVTAAVRRIAGECYPYINNWESGHYLEGRGIDPTIAKDLYHHPYLFHTPSGGILKAMVALVRDLDGNLIAVHRTYIDGSTFTKAKVTPTRMALGPISGCAVHLIGNEALGPTLYVSEGIENALSFAMLNGMNHDNATVWAALSAAGIANLIVPNCITKLVVICDNDEACMTAAKSLAARLIHRTKVFLSIPSTGNDFNDVLMAGARA
jgi:hypothetical protein